MREFFAVEEIRSRGAWQAAVAELIATFAFVFLGAGAVVAAMNLLGEAGPSGPTGSGLLVIALAHGLAIALLVASIARISGGHINPAVTVSMVVTQKIGLVKGAMYIVGQLVGAALGAYLLMAVIPDAIQVDADAFAFNRQLGFDLDPRWLDGPPGRTASLVRNWAREANVPLLELITSLRSSDERTFFVQDGHCNPSGHEQIARALAEWDPLTSALATEPARGSE